MNVWVPLCKYQVHQSHDLIFSHVGFLICKTSDFSLEISKLQRNYGTSQLKYYGVNSSWEQGCSRWRVSGRNLAFEWKVSDHKEKQNAQSSGQKIVAGELLWKIWSFSWSICNLSCIVIGVLGLLNSNMYLSKAKTLSWSSDCNHAFLL